MSEKRPFGESLEALRAAVAEQQAEALAVERQVWDRLRSEPGASKEASVATLRQALRRLMRELSEEYYCAGWLHGLEYTLWQAATEGPIRFGLGVIPAGTCLELAHLAELCGGWWHWPDGATGEVFVSLSEWRCVYSESSTGESDA